MKPYLYTVVNEEKLRDMLRTFNECMAIPIQVLDEQGEILQSYGGIRLPSAASLSSTCPRRRAA